MLDLDGVIVDWVGGLCKHFNKENPYSSNAQKKQDGRIENYFQLDRNSFWEPCRSYEFWANLNPTPWMEEIINFALDYFDKRHICILTSCGKQDDTGEACKGKVQWIKKHLPQFSDRFLIGHPKWLTACDKTFLIDDSDHQLDPFFQYGGNPLCVPQPYNKLWKLVKSDMSKVKALELQYNFFTTKTFKKDSFDLENLFK